MLDVANYEPTAIEAAELCPRELSRRIISPVSREILLQHSLAKVPKRNAAHNKGIFWGEGGPATEEGAVTRWGVLLWLINDRNRAHVHVPAIFDPTADWELALPESMCKQMDLFDYASKLNNAGGVTAGGLRYSWYSGVSVLMPLCDDGGTKAYVAVELHTYGFPDLQTDKDSLSSAATAGSAFYHLATDKPPLETFDHAVESLDNYKKLPVRCNVQQCDAEVPSKPDPRIHAVLGKRAFNKLGLHISPESKPLYFMKLPAVWL